MGNKLLFLSQIRGNRTLLLLQIMGNNAVFLSQIKGKRAVFGATDTTSGARTMASAATLTGGNGSEHLFALLLDGLEDIGPRVALFLLVLGVAVFLLRVVRLVGSVLLGSVGLGGVFSLGLRCGHIALLHALGPLAGKTVACLGYLEVYLWQIDTLGRTIGNLAAVVTLHPHGAYALGKDVELLGSTPLQVDDTPTGKGATVGDLDHYRLVVREIGYLEQGAEGIGAMGAGETVVMQSVAAGGTRTGGAFGIKSSLTPLRLCQHRGKAQE